MTEIERIVYEAIREASMCWNLIPSGVFDSTRAKDVGDRLIASLANATPYEQKPTAPASLVDRLQNMVNSNVHGWISVARLRDILSRFTPVPDDGGLKERVAQITAHRACHNQEQDLPNGKVAGYCIVCGVPWPCQYSGPHPAQENKEMK